MSLAAGLGACGSKKDCHNLALADALFGQTTFADRAPNAGGAVSASSLAAPIGGFVANAAGTVGYLADTSNNRILGYTLPLVTGAAANFVLGQGSLTTNTAGTGARGDSPFGLAAPQKVSVSSDDGKLVVADTSNNRVLIWNALPMSNVAPDVVLGQLSLDTNTAGPPTRTSLNNPTSAMIGNGKLVVVDQNNNRILIWNTVPTTNDALPDVELGQDASTIPMGGGSPPDGFSTNVTGTSVSSTTTSNQRIRLNGPRDVWTNGFGLYVSDTGNNRVLFWNQVPGVSDTTADAIVGQPTGFNGKTAGTSVQLLSSPTGVFSDGINLYVADTGNNRVMLFTSALPPANTLGLPATGVFGQQDFSHNALNDDDQNGQPGNQDDNQSNTNATQNTLNAPTGVFVPASGEVFVSDRGNNRLIAFPAGSAVDGSKTDFCTDYQRIKP